MSMNDVKGLGNETVSLRHCVEVKYEAS